MIITTNRVFHWMIECPETNELADADVSARNPIFSRSKRFKIQNCSRWPDRKACEQKCLNKGISAPNRQG